MLASTQYLVIKYVFIVVLEIAMSFRGKLVLGGVPTTPDPNTSAKVSRYKWEAYRDTNWWCIHYFLPYFCKSIAIEMGGVSPCFSKVSGSGVVSTFLIVLQRCHPRCICFMMIARSDFRVHANGVVLCERACFCLLSAF